MKFRAEYIPDKVMMGRDTGEERGQQQERSMMHDKSKIRLQSQHL